MLSWISSTKQLPQFVRTRVHKIKEISSNKWRFCPTSINPADLLPQGLNIKIFNERKQLRFQGPPWLREPEDTWPPQPETSIHAKYESPQLAVTIMADIEENPNILNIIDITKYSNLIGVVRVSTLLVPPHHKRNAESQEFATKSNSTNNLQSRNIIPKEQRETQRTCHRRTTQPLS